MVPRDARPRRGLLRIGTAVGEARVRERLLRLNADVTGHRLLRGAVFPGGIGIRAWRTARELREIASDVAEIVDLALNHSVVQDRFTDTAILTAEQVATSVWSA